MGFSLEVDSVLTNPSSKDTYHHFKSVHKYVDLCGWLCTLFPVCFFSLFACVLTMISLGDKSRTMWNLNPLFILIFLWNLFSRSNLYVILVQTDPSWFIWKRHIVIWFPKKFGTYTNTLSKVFSLLG